MSGGEFWNSVVLGIIQGIAEFLPISSSGHLVLSQELLGIAPVADEPSRAGLQINIALHLGTLGSILVIYWHDLLALRRQPQVCLAIAIATLPLVVIGLTLKDLLEQVFEEPLVASCGLLVTALLLAVGQRLERERLVVAQLGSAAALAIGLFQALAITPGISRSGSTIAGGLLTGLRREEAARFSFLIAIPAIGGATMLFVKDLLEATSGEANVPLGAMGVGALTAFLVGLLALKGLLRIVAQRRLHWFSLYCGVVGFCTLLWQLLPRS